MPPENADNVGSGWMAFAIATFVTSEVVLFHSPCHLFTEMLHTCSLDDGHFQTPNDLQAQRNIDARNDLNIWNFQSEREQATWKKVDEIN